MEKEELVSEINTLVNNHRKKLAENDREITELRNKCKELSASLEQAEAKIQRQRSSEYEQQIGDLNEALMKANYELQLTRNPEHFEVDDKKLQYFVHMENHRNCNPQKYCSYSLEFPENSNLSEWRVNRLKRQLLCFGEELSRISIRSESEKLYLAFQNQNLQMKLVTAAENEKQMVDAHSLVVQKLQDLIRQADEQRNKAVGELNMKQLSPEEYDRWKEETQLEAVGRENKELVALQKELKQLQKKFDELSTYADLLREEKTSLQVQKDEALAQHYETLGKYRELQLQIKEAREEVLLIVLLLEKKLLAKTNKIDFLLEQQELVVLEAACLDDLFSDSEDPNLLDLQMEVNNQQSQVIANLVKETESLRSELKLALETKANASSEQLVLANKLQEAVATMATQAGQFQNDLAVLKNSNTGLELKVKALQEENDALEAEAKRKNAQDLQNQLEKEKTLCAALRAELVGLEETKAKLEDQLLSTQIEASRQYLEQRVEVDARRTSVATLSQECFNLRFEAQNQIRIFHEEKNHLNDTVSRLVHEKKQLEEETSSLEAEFNRKILQMGQEIELRHQSIVVLTNECAKLRRDVQSGTERFLKENNDLNAIVLKLGAEKKQLEEKVGSLGNKEAEFSQEMELSHQSIMELTNECAKLRRDLQSGTERFLKENNDLNAIVLKLGAEKKQLEEKVSSLGNKEAEFSQEMELSHQSIMELTNECAKLRRDVESGTERFLKENNDLNAIVLKLGAEKKQLEEKVSSLGNKEAEFNQEMELSHQSIVELTNERAKLRSDLQTKTKTFHKKKQMLKSTISSLRLNKKHNADIITKLRADEAEVDAMKEASFSQQFAAEEAHVRCQQLMDEKQKLNQEIEVLRTSVKARQIHNSNERDNMCATISCLLEGKRDLEEKQCMLYDTIAKLEQELAKFKGNNSPVAPSNPDNKSSAVDRDAKKSNSASRKVKRKSAHDEHRNIDALTNLADNRPAALHIRLMEASVNEENAQLQAQMSREEQPNSAIEQRRARRRRRRSVLSPLGSKTPPDNKNS